VSISDPNAWLAAIVGSSEDAIVGKRLDSTVVSWNKGAERIFGFTAEEMIGASILKIFPPDRVHEEERIVAAISRGERIEHFESQRIRKDGRRIEVSISVSPILDPAGNVVGAAKIARDITDARRMEQTLRLLNTQLESQAESLREANQRLLAALSAAKVARDEAERANRVKSEFLASMSHELRTPLNAISGYADLMNAGIAGELPRLYREYVDKIQRSQRHLQQMITGVLDFSKLEAGTLPLELEETRVADVLARVEPLVEAQAALKRQVLHIALPQRSLTVIADPDRALQIVLNLLTNAIRFTPPDGAISVDAAMHGADAVAIRVCDNGPGIADADAERVFEPFVQLDHSLSRRPDGAGLGLAISRDLARAMGGDLTLQSAPGRGATFVLTLPRSKRDEAASA
jgi:PAS domain S-box-containing protein